MKVHFQNIGFAALCALVALCTLPVFAAEAAVAVQASESGDSGDSLQNTPDIVDSADSAAVSDSGRFSVVSDVAGNEADTSGQEDETYSAADLADSSAYDEAAVAEAESPSVYLVVDSRSDDDSYTEPVGMKAVAASLFGPYTPVQTDVAIPQTVDGTTTVQLYEAVASGSAGVDYAWVLSVLAFAVLLYCLIRILGVFVKC